MKRKNQKYEAFISYRHLPADIFIAEHLHKMLERYTIPKQIRRRPDEKHIGHIFRDRDELPVSMDLGESITEALKESKTLIVICTPETKKSDWVIREINEFIRLHGKRNIVCVLAEGEPEDAIPDLLLRTEDPDHPGKWIQTEPLAADVRGRSRREIKRKLRKEKLRILAQILEVPYDSLVQRDRIYRKKKNSVTALAAAAALFAVTVFGSVQAARIRNLNLQAMQEEARASVKTAEERLDQSDRIGALKVLLTSYDNNQGLEVPEQYSAFNNILHPYEKSNDISFSPCEKITADSLLGLSWSPNGRWAAAYGDGQAIICNLENGMIHKTLAAVDLDRKYKEKESSIDGIRIVSDEKAIVWVSGCLYQVELETGKILKKGKSGLGKGDGAVNSAASAGNKLWLDGDRSYSCVDAETMEVLLAEEKNDIGEWTLTHDIKVSEDGKRAAFILFDHDMANQVEPENEVPSDAELLPSYRQVLAADLDGKQNLIDETSIIDAAWMPDQTLLLLSKEDSSSPYAHLSSFRNGKKKASWGSYRIENLVGTSALNIMNYQGDLLPAVIAGESVIISDPETGKTAWDMEFSAPVNQILSKDSETFLIMTGGSRVGTVTYHSSANDGSIIWYWLNSGLGLKQFHPSYKNGTLHQVAVEFRKPNEWGLAAYRSLVPDEGESVKTGTMMDLRCGKLASGTDFQMSVGTNGTQYLISVVSAEDGSLIYSTSIDASEIEYGLYPNFSILESEGKDRLIWNDGSALQYEDLQSGIRGQILPKFEAVSAFSISPDGSQLYLCSSSDGILDNNEIYQKTGSEWTAQKNLNSDMQVIKAEWTRDGKTLVLSGSDWLRIWNNDRNEFTRADGAERLENLSFSYNGVDSFLGGGAGWRMGKERDWILVSQNQEADGVLKVIDLKDGSVKASLNAEQAGTDSLLFFDVDSADFTDHDRKLIIKACSTEPGQEEALYRISVVNLENGSVLSRQSLSSSITELLPRYLNADNDGRHFTLGSSGASISYDVENGWLRSGQALFELVEDRPVIKARFNTSRMFFDPDHQTLVTNFSDSSTFQRLVSYEELVQMARGLVEAYGETAAETEEF